MAVCYCNECKNAFTTKNENDKGDVCPKCGGNVEILSESALKKKRDCVYLSALHKKQIALYPRDLEEAKTIFIALGTYRDSATQTESCDYLINRFEERERKESQNAAFSPQKIKKVLRVVIPTVLALAAIITACVLLSAPIKYAQAKRFYKNGNLERAAEIFEEIPDHASSIEYLEKIYEKLSEDQGKYISSSTLLPYFTVNPAGAIFFVRSQYQGDGNIVIPDIFDGITVDSIGTNAFKNCSKISSVTIPDTVLSINPYAFYGCTSLEKIELPADVRSISPYAFKDCSKLKNINIPEGVTTIGEYAFSGCSSLSFPTLPSGLKIIENSTFMGCSSFKNVTLPDSLEQLKSHAFSGCSSITEINIPARVSSIGKNSFRGCDALISVSYGGSEDQYRKIMFDDGNEPLKEATIIFSS